MYDILTRFLSEGVEGMEDLEKWLEEHGAKLVALVCGISVALTLLFGFLALEIGYFVH